MDQLPRLGKRELICLLLLTCNYVVSVWRGFLFLWVLGMGCVILLWHSLSLQYDYISKMYSVLDASNGYWQIELSKDSQKYTTFNTPLGSYKYLRLPFGIKSSLEVFQRTVSHILENLDGCEVIADNILIWGKDTKEHNERLCAVLNRIREANMRLNKAKCKIGLTEVACVGHVFGPDGLKPSKEKVCTIFEIPESRNKKELQRFMGTVNYQGMFIPNL